MEKSSHVARLFNTEVYSLVIYNNELMEYRITSIIGN